MLKNVRNITFDEIKIGGKLAKRLFFYPRSNDVLDENGNKVGKYTVKNSNWSAIVDV